MAGGIFKNRPFVFNPKCIAFSAYSSLLFVAGGGKNPLIIALIFIMAYVLMAWYDYMFDCSDLLNSGTSSINITSSPLFKPQYRKKDRNTKRDLNEKNLVNDQEQAYLQKVYFFHAIFVAPLLIYVGFQGAKSNDNVWGLLGGMGGVAFIYHGLRLRYPREVWK